MNRKTRRDSVKKSRMEHINGMLNKRFQKYIYRAPILIPDYYNFRKLVNEIYFFIFGNSNNAY